MSDERERWNAYLWEPGGRVLKNKWGERDLLALDIREHRETDRRTREIAHGKIEIPHTYDGEHLRAIHAHLFGNVYEWAGEYRTVGMEKGHQAFAEPEHIGRYVGYARRTVEETPWTELGADAFAEVSAHVFAFINHAHPFREGNGRTSRIFMTHVAERTAFRYRFGPVDRETWNTASRLSHPADPYGGPDPRPLVPVFRAATIERDAPALALDANALRSWFARLRER
jgi:cell filamentation protein